MKKNGFWVCGWVGGWFMKNLWGKGHFDKYSFFKDNGVFRFPPRFEEFVSLSPPNEKTGRQVAFKKNQKYDCKSDFIMFVKITIPL